jgi:hypothetical protein
VLAEEERSRDRANDVLFPVLMSVSSTEVYRLRGKSRALPKTALDTRAQIGLLGKLKLRKCVPIPAAAGDRHFVRAARSSPLCGGKCTVIARAGVDPH